MSAALPKRPSLAPYESHPLQDLLTRTANRLPNKVAVIDEERRFTYRQLEEYSNRFAAGLARRGVLKSDRVGILAPNCVEFEIAFFGIIKVGAIATTINSGYREREIAHQINDSGAETLVVHEDLLETAVTARDATPGLKRVIVIKDNFEDGESFWGVIENAPSTPPSVLINPKEDLAALPYSSGTTGLSKGVMLTHFNLTSNIRQYLERADEESTPREDDVVLAHLPLFHIYGLQVIDHPTIAVGGTQVMMGRFDMEQLLSLMSEHRITLLFTVPPVGIGLTQYPGVSNYDLSALRLGLLAAAPSSAELQNKCSEALGVPIIQGYGMTELSPVANFDYAEPELIRLGSVGPPLSDVEEKVVDLEAGTREVANGDVGELMVRGPLVMKGYYDNPEATSETIEEDGWMHTGDIVRMDEESYVWVLDRKKELIKYKGFQVPPAELEGLLLQHPAVLDAAVIGKADVESGEIPKAFVVRRRGSEVSDEDIMSFVADKVATFKRVRDVEFVDSIPKNPSGKILRRVLMDQERVNKGS